MDRRVAIIIGFGIILAVAVIAIVAGRGGSGGGSKPSFTKPTVQVPSGPPPTKLVSTDIKVGSGKPAASGDAVSVQYVGVDYSTKQEFDSSYDRNQPFNFTLGQGMVIPCWDQGLVGMKPGGERQLVVPPALAYGAQGQPPKIGPNATLVFDIQLISD